MDEIKEILNLRLFDIICLNETKIDSNTPNGFLSSKYYKCIRRDRTSNGGGILVYIKKEYTILKQETSLDFEIIYFQLLIKNNLCNFICGYNPHNKNSKDFNDHLETNFLLSMNLNQNIYVIGDLNQELLSAQGKLLINLIENNGFNNHIFEATRINTVYLKNKNIFKTSRTLLDVILHNNDTIKQVLVTSCPFSDHKFVCCGLGFESIAHKDPIVNMRRLNDANLIEINKLIEISDFSLMHGPDSVDQKWT